MKKNFKKIKKQLDLEILEYRILLEQKEIEIHNLQSKINRFSDELIILAKQNSPYFWIRFQEIYPDYSENLLRINPSLKVSELTLSAYIYLGFTSKEIAAYTFKALKTIVNNRHNFRKRIHLSNNQDLSIWLRENL